MTSRRRLYLVCGVIALAVAAVLCFTKPSGPGGRYVADSRIGIQGDFYWEFVHGKWSLVYKGGRDDYFGTYARTGDGWVLTNRPDLQLKYGKSETWKIECSWFGVSFFDESGKRGEHFRRRVIPFLRPNWMPNWMQ